MRLISADTSDWHAGRPDVRPGAWSVTLILAVVLMLGIAALAGGLANGDGSPFLS